MPSKKRNDTKIVPPNSKEKYFVQFYLTNERV